MNSDRLKVSGKTRICLNKSREYPYYDTIKYVFVNFLYGCHWC